MGKETAQPSPVGVQQAFLVMGRRCAEFRRGGSAAFTEEDREELEKR